MSWHALTIWAAGALIKTTRSNACRAHGSISRKSARASGRCANSKAFHLTRVRIRRPSGSGGATRACIRTSLSRFIPTRSAACTVGIKWSAWRKLRRMTATGTFSSTRIYPSRFTSDGKRWRALHPARVASDGHCGFPESCAPRKRPTISSSLISRASRPKADATAEPFSR